ncbi:MAG: transporter substrate-binding domain-containing protein [Pseudomonadota bacterium]
MMAAARRVLGLLALAALALPACAMARADAALPVYLMTMPPLVIDSPGRRGMIGDTVLEAMRRAGLTARVLVEPNPRAMAMVRQHDDTLITALSRTPEREAAYTWVAPILPVQRSFYTIGERVDSFAGARKRLRQIAVSRNTANLEILLREGFTPDQLVEVNAGQSAPRMLKAGRVDAWFNLVPESEALLRQVGAGAVVAGARLAPTELYLACSRRCRSDYVQRLRAALAAMKADGSMAVLMNKYAAEPGFTLD